MTDKPCYVVEVTPKARRKYTKYIAWVAKDLWIQLKIDYYQDKDIYRSGTFKDVRMIDGIPTPFETRWRTGRQITGPNSRSTESSITRNSPMTSLRSGRWSGRGNKVFTFYAY